MGADKDMTAFYGRDIINTMFNRRTRMPTPYGWIVMVLILIIVLSSILRQEDPDSSHTNLNPKFQQYIHDPQEVEFEEVLKANQRRKDMPVIPHFDPNKHLDMIKPKPVQRGMVAVNKPEPKEFPVDIIHSPKLKGCVDGRVELLLIVQTRPDYTGGREAIRRTWGTQNGTRYPLFPEQGKWATLFVMGLSGTMFDKRVADESEKYGDILQGNFLDTPLENTRKFMLALKWLGDNTKICRPAFVMKTTDNTYHNMPAIMGWLGKKFDSTDKISPLYMGKLMRKDHPIRDENDPLYVSKADYPRDIFPDFIENPAYLFTESSILSMYNSMGKVTPIAMEDAYVGLLAEKSSIRPIHNDHFLMLGKTLNFCHHLKMFFISRILPSQHIEIFNKMKRAKQSPECMGAVQVEHDNRRNQIDI